MVEGAGSARRRRWADVVLIVAALYALFAAVWAPPGLGPREAAAEVAEQGTWWWAHAIGGGLALAAVFVAMRSAVAAKVMAALGGLVLLAGLAAFNEIDWLAIRTLVIPGVVILAVSPFIGPMPSPEEEGKRRRGLGS